MADHQIQQQQQIPPLKIVNDPPVFSGNKFSGNKRELDGFLTRVELAINAHPQRFINDAMRVNFVISYLNGKALNWASCLRRNNNAILNNLEQFLAELRRNFGDPDVEAVVANGRLCNIQQFKYGRVVEYITEFQKISQYSDFNESAKIYMFIRGLHYKMREHLALVNPNPNNLQNLFRDAINIENLTKRNDIREYCLTHQDRRNYNQDGPMDVDLYRIKKGQKATRYFPSHKSIYNNSETNKEEERRRKGLCFICGKAGHLQFNCPNKKKPKNFKVINKIPNDEASSFTTSLPSSSVRRIKLINDNENIHRILEIIEFENKNFKGKTNILDFFSTLKPTIPKKLK